MRKLVYGINLSIDGCCDHQGFQPDKEVMEFYTKLMRDAGAVLYGRKTYELMYPYWPEVAKNKSGASAGDNEFAEAFAAIPQVVVFSTTLPQPKESQTTVLRGNVKAEIETLKAQPGKNILAGGVSFPTQLLELGLIDEVYIVIHPGIVGRGRRLFDSANLSEIFRMKLVETRTFKSGCVLLWYSRS